MSKAISETATAPTERVKPLPQVRGAGASPGQAGEGTPGCEAGIPKGQRVLSSRHGHLANGITTHPTWALNFALNGRHKQVFPGGVDDRIGFGATWQ